LAHQNLASTLRDMGRYKEALNSYNKALKIKPNSSKIYREIGITNYYLRDLKESIFNLEKALEIDPENVQASTFLFRLYLSHNELVNEYSSKIINWYSASQNTNTDSQQNIENKNWRGESDLKILVTKAKDIGDQLLYSSILIDLAKISKSVIVECDKRLSSILKRSLPKNVFFIENRQDIISNKAYDREIKAYQLIYFLRKDINSFMTSQGYLKNDSNETLRFKSSLKDTINKRIIGISWKTLNKNKLAKKRNIDLEMLIKSIWKNDVLLLNLQYGDVNEEIELVSEKLGIKIHQIENINNYYNLDSLASIISACSMVVTIDNTVGHLSGSLGVDTKLLLDYTPSPIWGLKENSSYIYKSIKIFRQKKSDDWSNVYSELKSDLLSNLKNS
jgi:tetratricopeptide (TPR) repeat protein